MSGTRAALLVLASVLAGCTSPGSAVLPLTEERARQPAPRPTADDILVLYAHGSRQEYRSDFCFPGSITTPNWLHGLAGTEIAGRRVFIQAVCTPSRVGEFDHRRRTGIPKVVMRTRDLESTVRRHMQAGLPPGRIFLMGHSAGGWASLLALHDGDPPIAGVIAFAPAFAGPLHTRSNGWQWLRDRQAERLAASEQLPALVFAYRGDAFESPAALAFLRPIPGLQLVTLDTDDCGSVPPHRGVFSSCVMDAAQRQRVRRFMEQRHRP